MIKRLLPLIFAIGLGVIGLALARTYFGKQQAELAAKEKRLQEEYKNPLQVVVASANIPAGTTIAQNMLAPRPIPEKYIIPTATGRPEDVVGLVTQVPFSKGEPILRDKLQRPGEDKKPTDKLSDITPQGKRAVAIDISETSGVSSLVKPGDKVDVLWTFQTTQGQNPEIVTMTLLQDIAVLAVDGQMIGSKAADPSAGVGGRSGRGGSITLALSPQEAGIVLYAKNQGQIQLSLRSPGEKGKPTILEPTDRASVMEAVLGKDPFAKSAPRQVEICKGLECKSVSVTP